MGSRRLTWPRTERLYQPPLVIIPQSPGDDRRSSACIHVRPPSRLLAELLRVFMCRPSGRGDTRFARLSVASFDAVCLFLPDDEST